MKFRANDFSAISSFIEEMYSGTRIIPSKVFQLGRSNEECDVDRIMM
jgi:hypothetical protein